MANSAVGPYICRQLIQRLVTSHPKPEYVHRVVRAFNGEQNVDGVATGIRGDMKEVFRAILLDYEARSTDGGGGSQVWKTTRTAAPRHRPGAGVPCGRPSQQHLRPERLADDHRHHSLAPPPGQLVSKSASANFVDSGGSADLPGADHAELHRSAT